MRISPTQADLNFLRNHQNSRDLETEILERLSSLKRVNRPSDDPAATAKIQDTKTELSDNAAFYRTVHQVLGEFGVVENTFDQLIQLTVSAHEKAVQGASETYSAGARAAIADEIDQIREEMIAQLNTQIGNTYLFSGTDTDIQPFDAAGNYLGNTDTMNVRINQSETMQVKFIGSDIAFGTGGMGSADDMLQLMTDLSTELRADNTAGIDATLARFDTVRERLNTQLGTLGAKMATLLREDTRIGDLDEALKGILADIEDADIAEEITNLTLNKTGIEAQLKSHSQITRLNLFDFLG